MSDSENASGSERSQSETDSDLEYTDSESESSDSYVYPWDTSSDDSWADLSSDDVIQKILLKLPTYDPPDSNDESKSDQSVNYSSHSDSMREKDDAPDLYDLDFKYPPKLDMNGNEIDSDDDPSNPKNPRSPKEPKGPLRSQLRGFEPNWYLKSFEHFEIYLENQNLDDGVSGDISDAASAQTSPATQIDADDDAGDDAGDEAGAKQKAPITLKPSDSATVRSPSPAADEDPKQPDIPKSGTKPAEAGAAVAENPAGAGGVAGAAATKVPDPRRSKSTTPSKKAPSRTNSNTSSTSATSTTSSKKSSSPNSPAKNKGSKRNSSRVSAKITLSGKKKNSNSVKNGKNSKATQRKSKDMGVEPIKTDSKQSPRVMVVGDSGTPAVSSVTQQKEIEAERLKHKKEKQRKRKEARHKDKAQMHRNKKGELKRRFREGDEVIVKGALKGHGIIRYIGPIEPPEEIEAASNDAAADATNNAENAEDATKAENGEKKARKPLYYGVELIEKGSTGDCDGAINGYRFFDCPENKAVFVRRKEIHIYTVQTTLKRRKMLKMKRNRHNAQLFGNAVEQVFGEKVETAKTRHNRAPRKLGPRDYGRTHGFVGGDKLYKIEDTGEFLEERYGRRGGSYSNVPKEKKLGPREIGTAHGWRGIKIDEDSERKRRESERLRKEEQERALLEQARKQGPRDIGTAHGWKGTKIDEERERKAREEQERRRLEEEERILQESRKLGPREMGTTHGWKGTKVDTKKEQARREKEEIRKREEEQRVLEQIRKEKQQGPRDVSKPKNWKGMKYNEKEEERKRAAKKEKEEQKKMQKKEKKAGPRELGTAHGWKGYKYDESEEEARRAKKAEEEERKKREKIGKKMGPREIRKMSKVKK